ncbi:fructoselysine 6-kinase [Verminephrobacter aporrectodeae subsp. tuberculatae]|uniref:PfkB family carbohydrate kinase n=1 Tax=Verminephrobacter aporrectodeae TaxID=1110389 RepID=UPI0022388848|nr:PfkB family carbohydrate kinase [Verminephrobacter aporrectodeae]MCW5219798.1 fructoselysine 6-kinase [Verminephrobacter aporrectodeae subsp. tuberculatae]MCW5287504.1 fructoselysine 6-kinase [Verminephrobacter aporrectodeae subsp. tuberculatae]
MTRTTDPVRARAKLVAIGDNCLDAFVNKNVLTVGGNALNVAVYWRRAGWDAGYFGAVGRDPEGDLLLTEIAAAGLDPEHVERRCGDTAVTLLCDDAGERRFLLEAFGVGAHYMPSPQRYAQAAAADWVHLGTNANPELVRRLVADAVPFSIDLSTAPLALPLDGVPLVFGSAKEPVEPLLAALRAAGARQVVLTCGRAGAYFHDGTRLRHVAAVPVEVVDTCGAGDSFIAAFLTAWHFGDGDRDADLALAQAAHAAARTCTHLGGFPQALRPLPDWFPAKYAGVIQAQAGQGG